VQDSRPDPDALLASIRTDEAKSRRGRLKVFFGMSPGVGKTFAMLRAAQQKRAEGVEVVVGIVETHGRAETLAMLEGLPIAPRVELEYRGTKLEELDLDAVLLWRPQLLLVDELAHTNAPGSRHPKRYQDVLELIDAGIDVFTTLNVQHVESRTDSVRQITGVAVREAVPDSILDAADDIELIDLTPEQLRQRLTEGKVYLGERAAAAAENFFRPENLTALREMALRVTAEHVDRDLRVLRQGQNVDAPWDARERLMVAVSASPHSEELIRWTRRAAASMEASWLAVHVEPSVPRTHDDESRVTAHLALARRLGAEVIGTTGPDIGAALLRVARQHNVSQIVAGKAELTRWREWLHPSPVRWLLENCGGIDLHLVGSESAQPRALPWRQWLGASTRSFWAAVGAAAVVTVFGLFIVPFTGYWTIALVYLLAVAIAGTWLRRGPTLLLATLSALAWDYLFIPPRFTFYISHTHDFVMFAAFFIVALLMGQLTTRLRERELAERDREARAVILYRISRALAASGSLDESLRITLREVQGSLCQHATVLLPGANGLDAHPAGAFLISPKEESVAAWCYQNRQPAGRFTDTLPESEALHLPLLAGDRAEGVLSLRLERAPTFAQREILEACAAQLAIVLAKDRALRAEREASLASDSERLQKTLLDSVSHELKTPLAAIQAALEQPAPDLVEIRRAAARLHRVVDELLDVTRLEGGLVQPRREWCDVPELLREAQTRADLPPGALTFETPADLPPIHVDAALIGQALTTLFQNAVTHGSTAQPPAVSAYVDGEQMVIAVADRGPGLPPGDEERVFARFYRAADARPGGLGLGLAIARRLVEAHGGTLTAANRPEGGARFTLRLPRGGEMKLPA
jgi:two-component system sensor histidine kinase KdpD